MLKKDTISKTENGDFQKIPFETTGEKLFQPGLAHSSFN